MAKATAKATVKRGSRKTLHVDHLFLVEKWRKKMDEARAERSVNSQLQR
jgi:hypothetical protein